MVVAENPGAFLSRYVVIHRNVGYVVTIRDGRHLPLGPNRIRSFDSYKQKENKFNHEKKKITRSKNTYKRHRDRGHQDSPWPPGLTPGAAIVPRAIPVEWWDSPLETAATDGAEGLSLHEPEVPLRLPVLTVFPASLLFRRESQKATIRVTEESRDLKEAHAGRSSQRPREVAAGWIDNR